MMDRDQARIALCDLEADESDLFFYSGDISGPGVYQLIQIVRDAKDRRGRAKASLVLTTYGGDPHRAYQLAWLFQSLYEGPAGFRLVVLGPCKSAGTLVAVGAGELAMDELSGELGPLDVQLAKPDEIAAQTSGIDVLAALAVVQSEALGAFLRNLAAILRISRTTVSTRTACEIAASFVSELFRPITSQIDPHRLSEANRGMWIAKAYGERLGAPNLKRGAIGQLIGGYPTHGFLIGKKEALGIFDSVISPTETERAVSALFRERVMYPASQGDKAEIYDVVGVLEYIVSNEDHTAGQADRLSRQEHSGTESGEGASLGKPSRQGGSENVGSQGGPVQNGT